MKFLSYDIVFREIPDEVTLALNISQCPHLCAGCHSPHLREDIGELLDSDALCALLEQYGRTCTCVAFMGGDATPEAVQDLAEAVHVYTEGRVRTCWYSGFPDGHIDKSTLHGLDYVKFGPYIEKYGPLNYPTTNQRMYRLQPDGSWQDITSKFWKGAKGL